MVRFQPPLPNDFTGLVNASPFFCLIDGLWQKITDCYGLLRTIYGQLSVRASVIVRNRPFPSVDKECVFSILSFCFLYFSAYFRHKPSKNHFFYSQFIVANNLDQLKRLWVIDCELVRYLSGTCRVSLWGEFFRSGNKQITVLQLVGLAKQEVAEKLLKGVTSSGLSFFSLFLRYFQ